MIIIITITIILFGELSLDPKPPMEIRTTAAAKCSHFSADEIEALKEFVI